MVNHLLIVKTLEKINIEVRGLGQVVVDPATIMVGNNSVVARCRVAGKRGYKTIKCYIVSRYRGDVKGIAYYPKSLTVCGFSGSIVYVDVAISSWVNGRALDIVLQSGKYDIRMLSSQFDIMALRHLRRGVIHGDIKPENIIVLSSGKMKLVDSDELPVVVEGNCRAKYYGSESYTHPLRALRRTDEFTDHYGLALISSFLAAAVYIPNLFDIKRPLDEYISMVTDVLREHNDKSHYNLMVAMQNSIMGKIKGIVDLFESIVVADE